MEYNSHLDGVFRSPPSAIPANVGTNLHAGERTELFLISAWQEFLGTLTQADFIRYPNDIELRQQLAEHHSVPTENILLFAGADEALDCIVRCFAAPTTQIIVPQYHFPMYDVYAARAGATLVKLQYDKLTLTSATGSLVTSPRLVIVANPNSPVGDSPSLELFADLEKLNVPIVVDSVYCDFGSTQLDVAKTLEKNYIFVRSFSKSFGGAGARIGYVIANSKIISILDKVRPMVSVTGASIKFAQWALSNVRLRDQYVNEVVNVRKEVNAMFPWNIGGNWVHIPPTYARKLDELKVKYKSNCYLPVIDIPLIRISASPIILSIF